MASFGTHVQPIGAGPSPGHAILERLLEDGLVTADVYAARRTVLIGDL